MVVIFDLDDTLYSEITFVKSGFKAVSAFISSEVKEHEKIIFEKMLDLLKVHGRGQVFNLVLDQYGIKTKKKVKKCLSIYRTHFPDIELPSESVDVLKKLSKLNTLYVVTDGNKVVQRNKLKALKINDYVKKGMPTHNYGVSKSKPSTYCFELIRTWEKTSFNDMIYVGDNPNKDFVNIKKIGINTIRINQGMFKDVFLSKEYTADFKVSNLSEIEGVINSLEERNEK